ncbi:hypothetical protein [Streptomyces sp. NPDC002156]
MPNEPWRLALGLSRPRRDVHDAGDRPIHVIGGNDVIHVVGVNDSMGPRGPRSAINFCSPLGSSPPELSGADLCPAHGGVRLLS